MSRPTCTQCTLPQARCICPWVERRHNRVPVLILQHPKEAGSAKNTAGLLHLSLSNSERHVGEAFSASHLNELLGGNKTNVLLYPHSADPDLPEAPSFEPTVKPIGSKLGQNADNLRLVVLDATWRKSRKMLYLNPALQQLPRLALTNPPPSAYRIRTAQAPGQLSTLEASCYALALLENDPDNYRPLLAAFNRYIEQHPALAARAPSVTTEKPNLQSSLTKSPFAKSPFTKREIP